MPRPNHRQSHAHELTLFGQFRARLGRYALGFGLLLAYQAAQYWFDTRLARAIDVARLGDLEGARFIALSLVIVAILAFGVRIASRVVIFFAGRDAEYDVRKAFLAKLYALGPSFYAQASTGDLMSRATNDLTQVRLLLGFGVLNVINTALALVSALSVMLSISPTLTLASMASLPLLVIVTRAFAKRIFLRTRENQAALGAMSDTVQLSLSAARVIRAYGLEPQEAERFEVDNTRVLERGLDLARLRGLMGPLMQGISAIGTVVVFWYGGWLLMEHRISAGGLLSFVRALARLTWPLIALGFLVAIVQRGRAAWERLSAVFDAETDPEPASIAPPVPGRPPLEVRQLSYSVGEREILKDVDFALQRGERVAIVGPTGAGKTTLARLLARALPAPFGSVYLDGREISMLPLSTVRRSVCYAQQVPFLFSTTVAENLAFALDETSSDTARDASTEIAKRVRIHSEICQLVHGYDTVVGERGIQLSGGQRQRVALGRALLARSEVLILDDPTSAVDVGTERALCDLFAHLGRERSIVIVTHRVSLASTCDRVIVLDQGRIVQAGPPAALAQEAGLYKRFSDEQRLASEIEASHAPAPKSPESRPSTSFQALASATAPESREANARSRERALRDYHEEAVLGNAFNWRLYRELTLALRSERTFLIAAAVAVVLVAGLGLLRPLFVRKAIDAAVSSSDTQMLARLGVAVAILALFEQLLGFAQTYMTQLAGATALARLRHRVFAFLHRMPIAFFDMQPVGRLTTRVTNDIDAIQELFASGILASLGDLIRLIGIVALMLSVNVPLSVAAFGAVPVIVLLVLRLRRPMRNAFRSIRSQTARMNAALNEQISGMAVVQAFDKMQRSGAEFDRINLAHRDAHLSSIRYEAMQDAALETVASISLAAMVFVFGNSAASLGTLLAFQIYLTQFFEPLSQLTQRYTLLQSAMAGAERVFGLLALPDRDAAFAPELDGPSRTAPLRGAEMDTTLAGVIAEAPRSVVPLTVSGDAAAVAPSVAPLTVSGGEAAAARSAAPAVAFHGVNFAYHTDVPVLHDVSFSVAPGEHVALVGPTGSGKSTIAALLIRLYEQRAGRIEVMGKSIRDYDVTWLRRQFAMVPQDPWLFRGTLLHNIAGADQPSRERAREVLMRMRALEHFEQKLGGLDASVGAKGVEYSVGERQLVAFARALYRDSPILLLDEATASIDSETEGRLQRALLASLVGRTAIVIAHRLSTIKTADRILVMQQGRLVESGTHQQLLQMDGLYRRLVALSSVRVTAPERVPAPVLSTEGMAS